MKSMGVAAIAATVALTAAAAAMSGGAGAAAEVTKCEWKDTGAIAPAVGTDDHDGTYSTRGETGTIECDGPISGQSPTGPGTIGFEATFYGTSCQSGGTGAYAGFFTFPTADGTFHGVDFGTFKFGLAPPSGGLAGGTFEGEVFSGNFEVFPTKGDCATGISEVRFETKDVSVAEPRRKKL